ncbi:hypothetical protein B0H19DRAFT_1143241 [Mycena capillaripes]|nr:hypothetical protein B0H19DRAFT_1143241 [Mycena capillaripes]
MTAQDPRRIRIAEINDEIARLHDELQTLTESLVFLVITLPVEITSQIFVHCLPDLDERRDVTPSDAPLFLGRWRNIALSTPQLWTFWSFSIDRNATASPSLFSALELWLSRSKNRPLSIRLHYPTCTTEDEATKDFTTAVIPIIRNHYRQWEDAEFSTPVSSLAFLASESFQPTGLPLLRRLTLGSSQEDWAGPTTFRNPITLFMDAPHLRSVHLILGESGFSVMGRVHLPWAQLTSFTGTSFTADECLSVLKQTPSLVDCVFYIVDQSSDELLDELPPLVELKSLRLDSAPPRGYILSVLAHLTLPKLGILFLGDDNRTDVKFALGGLIERSVCALRHFSCVAPSYTLLAYLENMRELSTLEILDCTQREVATSLEHLRTADGSLYIQHLEGLTISCRREAHEGDFPFETLLKLLRTMSEPGRAAPLRCFRLVWTTLLPFKPDAQEIRDFGKLREKGMNVYIGTHEVSWV